MKDKLKTDITPKLKRSLLQKPATKRAVVMAKIPYLIRRKNIFYFRLVVPVEFRKSLKVREITQSLRTENREEATHQALKLAAYFRAAMHNHKTGKTYILSRSELMTSFNNEMVCNTVQNITIPPSPVAIVGEPLLSHSVNMKAPLLSVVIDDFLERYDQKKKATLTKLNATLPILLELVGDKPVNQILQADINAYFDDVQKLPVRRDAKIFSGMSLREIMVANTGKCVSAGTFKSTYRACVSMFINWATVNYSDQGFPNLSTQGAVYHGERSNGINKQRAIKSEELKILFEHEKMGRYAADSELSHYFWLPLIGLYTGARINEICQLNPVEDILKDKKTGIWYLWFNDESDTADGVDKSIKCNSSKRVVPIHSKLLNLGFLDYVNKLKAENNKLLFPQWQPRNGKASANAAKWFSRYLESVGLRDETEGERLSGFHALRHTYVTFAMTNKIQGVFEITGHEVDAIEGVGKISDVAKGYWTRELTDNIQDLKDTIEKFDFRIEFYKPSYIKM